MKNKILLPLASAVLASTLVFTVPAQAEENTMPTIVNEENATETEAVTVEATEETATDATEEAPGEAEVVEETADTETVTEETYEDIISEVEEDTAGIEPDSFLYSFKVFLEEVQLFFTFDDEKKAELLAQLANERLLEADFAAEKGDLELLKELIQAYEEKIAALEELAKDAESVTDETYKNDSVIEETYEGTDSVLEETYGQDNYKLKNIAALTMVYNKVPDHVKPIIQRNIERAMEKREAHLAKKQLKQVKKSANSVDEVIATEESIQTPVVVEAEVEATTTDKKIGKTIKEDKANKTEKVTNEKKENKNKDTRAEDRVETRNVDKDASDNTGEAIVSEAKEKGKGNDNKSNNGKNQDR